MSHPRIIFEIIPSFTILFLHFLQRFKWKISFLDHRRMETLFTTSARNCCEYFFVLYHESIKEWSNERSKTKKKHSKRSNNSLHIYNKNVLFPIFQVSSRVWGCVLDSKLFNPVSFFDYFPILSAITARYLYGSPASSNRVLYSSIVSKLPRGSKHGWIMLLMRKKYNFNDDDLRVRFS